eukprot:CAMPEP_0204902910 /NCGR_PEP_ID=MMETSP1397-20131031/3953_1 /ASSEMBLY_ACC=CAM_ASM_000891 /TAXON_ID=49980 /ORGANISM="Climacostomum Climacostomum virens, Strain Stock W-24" /LENGTH=55 /DNA_ID=CAMNT_0052071487 /DNA_START=805 /DNA_END=969 /DNA_ORIENTATION=+
MAPCVSFKADYDTKRLEFLEKAKQTMLERCKEEGDLWRCCSEVTEEFLGSPYSEF